MQDDKITKALKACVAVLKEIVGEDANILIHVSNKDLATGCVVGTVNEIATDLYRSGEKQPAIAQIGTLWMKKIFDGFSPELRKFALSQMEDHYNNDAPDDIVDRLKKDILGEEPTEDIVKGLLDGLGLKAEAPKLNPEIISTVEGLIEGKEPSNEEEQKIYNNMKDRTVYFSNFKNKEEYVKHNSAYWNYAYLDENGWKDMDDCEGKDIEWVSSFYEKFVVPIKPEQRVTIFEFTRNSDEEIEIEEDF